MYNMRLREKDYPAIAPVHRLNKFRVGQHVIYSGRTNYSWGDSDVHHVASKKLATIINKTENNITLQLDDYRRPYRTESSIPFLNGVDVIPVKQYAIVTECDLACGCKVVDTV